jgi:hypothetical protein
LSKWKQLWLQWQNLPTSFITPQPKAKAPQPSTQAFPTKGNFNKNVKKKEHNANKREVFQAHVARVQTLQNELESLSDAPPSSLLDPKRVQLC